MHAKRELSDRAKLLAIKLFNDPNNHIPTETLLEAQDLYRYGIDFDNFSRFSGLRCTSLFGIVEIVAALVAVEGCDIYQEDCVGTKNGGAVEVLLDINPDQPNLYRQTPLFCATRNGLREWWKYCSDGRRQAQCIRLRWPDTTYLGYFEWVRGSGESTT